MLLASTSSARPADTLPRLVAGLHTLLRDLTSSDSIQVHVPGVCGIVEDGIISGYVVLQTTLI